MEASVYESESEAFFEDEDAKTAIVEGLAETVGVQPENIALDLSIARRKRRGLLGPVTGPAIVVTRIGHTIYTSSNERDQVVLAFTQPDLKTQLTNNIAEKIPIEYTVEIQEVSAIVVTEERMSPTSGIKSNLHIKGRT